MDNNCSYLKLSGCKKSITYDPDTNLPMLNAELGTAKSCNLMQDGSSSDTLSTTQRLLLCWHRRLIHTDFDKLKYLARKGLLPEEIRLLHASKTI